MINHEDAEELQLWSKRIERWRDTLLTRGEYAAELGIDEGTWRRWERFVTGRVVSVRRIVERPALPETTCARESCGQVFTPFRDSQSYCCRRCRDMARNARWSRRERAARSGEGVALVLDAGGAP